MSLTCPVDEKLKTEKAETNEIMIKCDTNCILGY